MRYVVFTPRGRPFSGPAEWSADALCAATNKAFDLIGGDSPLEIWENMKRVGYTVRAVPANARFRLTTLPPRMCQK